MKASPRLRRQWHRKLFPALWLVGLACLFGYTILNISPIKAESTGPTVPPGCAPGNWKSADFPTTPSPVADKNPKDQTPPSSIILRPPAERINPDHAWQRSLKPRQATRKVAPVSPPGRAHRLIVKFADPLEARARRDGTLTLTARDPAEIASLHTIAKSLRLRFRPIQTAPEASLNALRNRAALRSGQQQPDPMSLVEVLPADSSPESVRAAAMALMPLAAVEYVEIESLDAPPPPPASDFLPDTPSLVSYQAYRTADTGIGVDYVWNTFGIRGDPSLRISDCEYQFNPQHEDLSGLITLQPGVVTMYSNFGDDHGTAVLGVLASAANGYGMTGSVQDSQMHFYPEASTLEGGIYQTRSATIIAAIADSAPGDIVMLEMQAQGPTGKYGPAEYQFSVWNAVKTGTDAGVIIIAAAGNGSQNLDDYPWTDYRNRGDSGAILVGAGNLDRSRVSSWTWGSTYGSRVNLQGWGTSVATTGYGSLMTCGDDPNQKYTSTFSGTSSATPMVASAAALIQSVSIQKRGIRLSPAEMRSLLVATGNPQTSVTSARIGPLPDLTAAIPQLLAAEFSNSAPIDIPDFGEASPFPSTIQVSGVEGVISAVRVKIENLNHSEPRNIDVLLVSPDGRFIPLMSDAGGSSSVTQTTLSFDDTAPTSLPESTILVAGRHRPTDFSDFGGIPESPPPGSTGPAASGLISLAAGMPNGDWKLYISDDHAGGSGSIASWSISFETTPFPTVALSMESSETLESEAQVAITATLSEATTVDVSVPFTISGTASDPEDFSITASPILIPAGQTTGSAHITLTDDVLDEADETIVVTLAEPSNAIAASEAQTLTILDNDVTLVTVSPHGGSTPAVGDQVFTTGDPVTASVISPQDSGSIRHLCTGWTGTGSVPAEGNSSEATFTIQETSSITWNWTTENHLDILTSGEGMVDAESGWHPSGTEITLTATATSGHRFVGWTLDSGTITVGDPASPQITVLLDEPISLTANFAWIPVGILSLEPELAEPPGHGGTADFGSPVIGTSPVSRSFTIRNTGDAALTGIQLALDGVPGFSASDPATSLEPGESSSFVISFMPPASGQFNTTLSINSSDPPEEPFQLHLSGRGRTARQAYEEWAAAAGLSDPGAPQGDGTPVLIKYAFNVNAATPEAAGLPCATCETADPEPVFRLEYLRRKNSGLNYTALQMTDPGNGGRMPMAGTTHVADINTAWERVTIEQPIDPAEPLRFFTVEVTLPDAPP